MLQINSPGAPEEVTSFLTFAKDANFKNVEHDFHEEIDAGHGRIETRRVYAIVLENIKNTCLKGLSGKN